MFLLGSIEILILIGLVILVVVLVAWLRPKAARGTAQRAGSSRSREGTLVARGRLVGVALGALLGFVVAVVDPLGRGLVVAPAVFGLVVLLAVIITEWAVRPLATTGVQSASLRPRSVRQVTPVALTATVGVTLLAGLALCAYTWVTASPDDLGRAGRALHRACTPLWEVSRGPYPGSFYVVPYLTGVAAALVVAGVAAREVVLRPRGGMPAQAEFHRRRSLRAIVGAVAVVVAAPLWGIAMTANTALLGFECPMPGSRAVGWASVALACWTFAMVIVGLVNLFSRASLEVPSSEAVSDGARV